MTFSPGLRLRSRHAALATLLFLVSCHAPGANPASDGTLFTERFEGPLDPGWRWVGEFEQGWRLAQGRIAIRTHPAGIHGQNNEAQNILLRKLPDIGGPICVDVFLNNRPHGLYENAGLLLYVDDENYVRVNKEAFPGHRDPPVALQVVSEIEGVFYDNDDISEDNISEKVPYKRDAPVYLRMRIDEAEVTGFYREYPHAPWLKIGTIRRPITGQLWCGIETSYGVPGADRWARFDDFEISSVGE